MTTKNAESIDNTDIKPPIKKKKSYRVHGTMKQKIAIDKIVENGGVVSRAMIQAGYSKNTAINPDKLTNSKAFKQALPALIDRLQDEIDRAISLMPKKIGRAKYRDMVEAVDKLIKNRQLLTGNSTINADIKFKWGDEKDEAIEQKAI